MGSPETLFQRWIRTYASEEFAGVVRGVIDATDATAAELSGAEREAMRRCFVTTSRYEWMFWDMAYRREAWPV
jgi:thiaminase/transcriptional activator TenA